MFSVGKKARNTTHNTGKTTQVAIRKAPSDQGATPDIRRLFNGLAAFSATSVVCACAIRISSPFFLCIFVLIVGRLPSHQQSFFCKVPENKQGIGFKMKIAYHIGAHSADGDNLLRGLLKDKERLLQSGIAVPGPGKYRRRLREALAYAQDVPMTPAQGQEILQAILEGEQPQRLVMSAPNFMGFPKFAIEKNILYPDAHDRIANLINLLPADESEIHLSISSPVSFVPAVMALNTTKNQNSQNHLQIYSCFWWNSLFYQQVLSYEHLFLHQEILFLI